MLSPPNVITALMLRLHYVLGHGSHISGHRGQNGMDVTHHRGTGWANVTVRDCRGYRARFLNCQNNTHDRHGADEKPSSF